jgi:hypothetical protein
VITFGAALGLDVGTGNEDEADLDPEHPDMPGLVVGAWYSCPNRLAYITAGAIPSRLRLTTYPPRSLKPRSRLPGVVSC